MLLTDQRLHSVIRAYVDAAQARKVAIGHNFLFDERPNPRRAEAYNAGHAPAEATEEAFRDSHPAYLRSKVEVPVRQVPETFTPLNETALLSIAGDQSVVRMESLSHALKAVEPDSDKAILADAFDAVAQGRPAHDDAMGAVVRKLNNRPRGGGRPRFAAFRDELTADIENPDWMHRLRDRLGLAHFCPTGENPRIPVALMMYTVQEIIDQLAPRDRSRIVAVPTVLDSDENPHFFPAPLATAFGRTVDLGHDRQCERLVSEILHRRLRYEPRHVHKLGEISRPIPDHPIRELRNTHRICVSLEADLPDEFGAEIGDHVHG